MVVVDGGAQGTGRRGHGLVVRRVVRVLAAVLRMPKLLLSSRVRRVGRRVMVRVVVGRSRVVGIHPAVSRLLANPAAAPVRAVSKQRRKSGQSLQSDKFYDIPRSQLFSRTEPKACSRGEREKRREKEEEELRFSRSSSHK
jgi:hypothetical protein